MNTMKRIPMGLGWIVAGLLSLAWGAAQAQTGQALEVPYFPLPQQTDLCGEPVPLQLEDVRERFDREFTLVVYNHAQVYLWLKRKERFFPSLERQLSQQKLPDDLKYVAVAESDLLAHAQSPAGAVGPWQFIAATGAHYGLDQTRLVDERQDFDKSTTSAFRYLQDLHCQFQSWTLAIAAYNCGERRMHDEMRRQRVNDYYLLKLPLETERYIFRILAIKEILTHPDRYGYSLPTGAGYSAIRVDKVPVKLQSSVPIQTLAEAAGITYREFKKLNTAFISDTIPAGAFLLRVPEGRGKEFSTRLNALIAALKPTFSYHKVSKGETLTSIANRYNVSLDNLKEWNQLAGNTVKLGQNLKIAK
jgi:LysM repeat protein